MGAMLEPLSVAVYSVERCDVRMGDAVLVLGAGPIGLLCLLVAKAAGATQIAITGLTPLHFLITCICSAVYVIHTNRISN